MSFDIGEILGDMGAFALVIVVSLGILGLGAVTVFLERLWVFGRQERRTRALSLEVRPILKQNDFVALERHCAASPGLPFADVLRGGARAFLGTPETSALPAAELVRREVGRRSEGAAADVRRGMGLLASVGSISPFVGLLGTVVGIIDAFEGIAAEGAGGLGAVSAGIAEALVVTAFGLLIAIPSVLMFNYLNSRVDTVLLGLGQAASEFVDHVEARAPTRIDAAPPRTDAAAVQARPTPTLAETTQAVFSSSARGVA
ncbi:MAG: MotA/TolQ/ExbB proton channel family protein [Myxococcales bacterium]|nr:MotA/TolQ/ExbB proton channel family protein [Myxococcales bacterium]